MKAARQARQEARLSAAEGELRTLLQQALARTVEHGDCLFFNSRFRPDYFRLHQVSAASEALIALACECVELRETLGLPLAGTPGPLFVAACTEAADTTNHHRRGPKQLAAWLLRELAPPPSDE